VSSSDGGGPRQLGKYELLEPIGQGGMATVYLARLAAPGGASKQVALKLLHRHLSARPDFVGMFLTEMRVAMGLSHRNIVQTFDAGGAAGEYFLVMELMSGALARLLERGEPLPVGLALFIAAEVCAGLEHAHSFRGEGGVPVVHCDVSPGNILISEHGDVKLADFGVARAAGLGSAAGAVKGKLAYMAPEQAWGRPEPRSDLFALGAVLYAMLCGQPLRAAPSLEEVRRGPGRVELPAVRVSPALRALVVSCLQPDPGRRPPSAAELRRVLASEAGVLAVPSDGDPHARLRDFWAGARPVSPRDDRAQRLAAAMMEFALDVPSQPDAADQSSAGAEFEPDSPTVPRRDATAVTAAPFALDLPTVPRAVVQERAAQPARGSDQRTLVTGATAFGEEGSGPVIEEASAPTPPPRARPSRLRLPWAAGAALLAAVVALGLLALKLRGGRFAEPRAQVTADAASPVSSRSVPQGREDGAPRSDAPGPAASAAVDASLADQPTVDDEAEDDARAPRRPARRLAPGRLDVNASPWGKVYVNGRPVGETPVQGLRLAPGHYQVRVVNPARGLSAEQSVRVRSGQTTRYAPRLAPRP